MQTNPHSVDIPTCNTTYSKKNKKKQKNNKNAHHNATRFSQRSNSMRFSLSIHPTQLESSAMPAGTTHTRCRRNTRPTYLRTSTGTKTCTFRLWKSPTISSSWSRSHSQTSPMPMPLLSGCFSTTMPMATKRFRTQSSPDPKWRCGNTAAPSGSHPRT